jgi:hypothetical protein
MRNRVLAGVLAAGVALVVAAPATSEAGHGRFYRRSSYGRSWYRPYVHPYVAFGYRRYVPYASYGYRPYGYYDHGRYCSDPYSSDYYDSDPYYAYDQDYGQPYYRGRPVFVPRRYYAPRPFYRGYRGRPFFSIHLGF